MGRCDNSIYSSRCELSAIFTGAELGLQFEDSKVGRMSPQNAISGFVSVTDPLIF